MVSETSELIDRASTRSACAHGHRCRESSGRLLTPGASPHPVRDGTLGPGPAPRRCVKAPNTGSSRYRARRPGATLAPWTAQSHEGDHDDRPTRPGLRAGTANDRGPRAGEDAPVRTGEDAVRGGRTPVLHRPRQRRLGVARLRRPGSARPAPRGLRSLALRARPRAGGRCAGVRARAFGGARDRGLAVSNARVEPSCRRRAVVTQLPDVLAAITHPSAKWHATPRASNADRR